MKYAFMLTKEREKCTYKSACTTYKKKWLEMRTDSIWYCYEC